MCFDWSLEFKRVLIEEIKGTERNVYIAVTWE